MPTTGSDRPAGSTKPLPGPLLALIDKAVATADALADKRIADHRRKHPDDRPSHLITRLEKEFTALTVTTGAGTGAAAAVPGIGLPLALTAAGGDALVFLTAAATHGLAVARVHGSRVGDIEHQRALLLGILLGSNGTKVVLNTAGRVGMHWGQMLGETIPVRVLKEINRLLGNQLLKRYGPRAGVLFFAKAFPLGIGAIIGGGGNLAMARQVINSTRDAFGDPPHDWDVVAAPAPDTSADEDDAV
ncbi:hypothetical protein ACQCX2_02035 [Propionibacteriaceae bacterium Y1700]|uniref:hypothetical protein n=1 Tax=Microlunatus sp. Y1700 TaxID=3418487 RepID=UPI003DA79426